MVNYCCVPGCTNSALVAGISLHRFPKELKTKNIWKLKIRRDERVSRKVSNFMRVCSAHFLPTDYKDDISFERRVLKKGAVPTMFDFSAPNIIHSALKPMESKRSRASRSTITIGMKQEIISKVESGQRMSDVSNEYGLSKSTVGTILSKKGDIKKIKAAKGVTRILSEKQRCEIHEEMEKLLLEWIKEREKKRCEINSSIIREKAREIFADLKKETPHEAIEFKATTGWFAKFQRRSGITRSDIFCHKFQECIEKEGYYPQQIFSCIETELYWKHMPKSTYLSQDNQSIPMLKPMDDRMTLLLGANASGDKKLKPLLIYNSENPAAFEKYSIIKEKLPVLWRSNKKTLVTQVLFTEWLLAVCAPSIKDYIKTSALPLKALLLLDNPPGHPKDLENKLLEDFSWLTVKFLPPNTSVSIQPMSQGVIASFKELYVQSVFHRCFEVCQFSTMTLETFWEEKFDVIEGIRLIQKAWLEVSQQLLKSGWKKLCPPLAHGENVTEIMDVIENTSTDIKLEVDEDNIEVPIMEHEEPTTEFQEHANEEQKDFSSVKKKSIETSTIRDLITKWEDIRKTVIELHPNYVQITSLSDLYDENAINYFRKMLKNR